MNGSQTPSFLKKLGVSPGAKRLARLRPDPTLLLLLALCLPLLGPLFAPGYIYDTHDGRHSVFYLIQFDASLRDGAWWPRWAMHHIQGYGYPTFLIQAPLGLYLGEIFVLLGAGFTLAAKLSWAVGIFAGAWGMYALVKFWLGDASGEGRGARGEGRETRAALATDAEEPMAAPRPSPLAPLVAAVLYTYFPYHIADLYVRGALNDSLLLGWLPWVFLVFDRLQLGGVTQGWPRRLGVAMLVLAGTLLTHTFALLSIAPLLVTFVLFRLAQGWRRDGLPWRPALLAAAGGVGALLLCSIFLLPLFVEGRFLQQQVYVSNTYDFRNHFVQFGQYFSPFWGFGFSDDPLGANDGMSFALGPLLIILGIGALFVVGRARRARAEMIYLLAAGLALLLVMTPLAQPLWEALPPLAVIQFPWRLLALAGFVFSALGGLVAWNLADRTSQPAEMENAQSLSGDPLLHAASGLLVLALLGMLASWPYLQARLSPVEPWREDGRAVFRFEQEHPDMIAYTQWVSQPFTTTAMTADYAAPDYTEVHGKTTSLTRFEVLGGAGQVLAQESRGSSATGTVNMATPGTVKINYFYFPGWEVTVDGQPVAVDPAEPTGALAVAVPAGEHRIEARFGATPPRTLGALLSGLTLALALILIFFVPSRLPVKKTP